MVKTFEEKTGLKAKIKLATDSGYLELCEYIQRELQKIGIAIKVDVMPTATLKQARSQGKLEMFPIQLDRGLSGCWKLPFSFSIQKTLAH